MTVHPQALHHATATTPQGQPAVIPVPVQSASVPQLKVIQSPTLNNTTSMHERNNSNATTAVIANPAPVHFPHYSEDDGSPQSLPEDQLDTMYEYWDINADDNSGNNGNVGEFEYEEEFNLSSVGSHSSNQHGMVMQPIQHQIIENHQKYYKMGRMSTTSSTPAPYVARERRGNSQSASSSVNGEATCAVCGDGCAKLHYGVLACYGCKGFFRRTLTGKYRYACRFGNNCVVDKYQRNSCRFCRFNRCLEVGMDPKAVRPDRDLTGKQKVPRVRKRQIDEELINHMMRLQGDDWSRKIPVDAKVLLMQLLNIESKVAKGDRSQASQEGNVVNTRNVSLRELFEQKPNLASRRTEMSYEPCRMARPDELPEIAHRGAIAAVDWVDSLAEIGDFVDTEDKIALVKACHAPLTIFNFSARTAQNTKVPDILCLCSHSYVPRNLPPEFNGTNHLSNNLIGRTLNELVAPLRNLNLREEEVVPLKAIIVLNSIPDAKGLSPQAQEKIQTLLNKIHEMLFQVVKELHHPVHPPSSRFGNLLLLLPTIATLSSVMCENMQFCQVFGTRANNEPLLNELFDNRNNNIHLSNDHSPPMFDAANLNLHPIMQDNFLRGTDDGNVDKLDMSTQTETDNCLSPINSLSSISLIGSIPSSEHGTNRSPSMDLDNQLCLSNNGHGGDDLQNLNFETFEGILDGFGGNSFSPHGNFDFDWNNLQEMSEFTS